MQKSWHVSHKTVLGVLSFSMPIFVLIYEHWHAIYRFSSEFKFVVFILTGAGIVLGTLGLWRGKEINTTSVLKAAGLIGIILNAGLLCFAWVNKPPEMTGTILNIYSFAANESHFGYERSLRLHVDLPAQAPVERNVDLLEPIFIVNITGDTAVYEQTGKSQKRVTDKNQLQENQHIRVEWAGFIWITDPAQVDATSVTILNQ